MWCNQIFSLLSFRESVEGQPSLYVVENIIVADNYEIANQIARAHYGSNAIALDTTLFPVYQGCVYDGDNFFSPEGVVIERNKTEQEKIAELENKIAELESDVSGTEVWDEMANAIGEGVNEV